MMNRPGWYLPPFEQRALDEAVEKGETYEPKTYCALRPNLQTDDFLTIFREHVGRRPWRLSVNADDKRGSYKTPENAALWAERAFLGGESPTGQKVQANIPEESSSLRVPAGVTVFARPEPESPYLWRDESVGEEPEEGVQRECAADIYEALLCTIEYPVLRRVTALERAGVALRSVSHPSTRTVEAEAEALRETLPLEGRVRIEAADKVLRNRVLSAEEKALLRLAHFRE